MYLTHIYTVVYSKVMNTHIPKVTLKGVATAAFALLLIAMAFVLMLTFIYLNGSHTSVMQSGRGWADVVLSLIPLGLALLMAALFCIVITPKR
jgi:hypothetical protein